MKKAAKSYSTIRDIKSAKYGVRISHAGSASDIYSAGGVCGTRQNTQQDRHSNEFSFHIFSFR